MPEEKTIEEKYLENPDVCPYCGSNELRTGETSFDYQSAYRLVSCRKCQREWNETFTLSGMIESDAVEGGVS